MTKPVTVVTGNTSKFEQIREALGRFDIRVVREDIDIPEIKDLKVEAVIADKARKAFEAVQGPVLVDDSGIYFGNYHEFPGTYSKFLYKTIGFEGIFKLIEPGDEATFISYAGYMDADLDEPILFRGEYAGTITDKFDQTKDYEMPYAPMFIPDGEAQDMASMTAEQRSKDHRHQAMRQFAGWYRANRT